MFGEERLLELLRSSAGMSAAGIADRIERAVLEFNARPPRRRRCRDCPAADGE